MPWECSEEDNFMDETGGKQEGKRRHKTRPWTLKDSEVLYKKKNQPIVGGRWRRDTEQIKESMRLLWFEYEMSP